MSDDQSATDSFRYSRVKRLQRLWVLGARRDAELAITVDSRRAVERVFVISA